MKVRAWLEDQGEIGKALVTPDSDLSCFAPSLLDAEVIGLPCPTCGGRGKRKDIWAGAVREVACPDCADTPVTVIAPEAMEAARLTFCAARHCSDQNDKQFSDLCPASCKDRIDSRICATLQALLPGARVAETVGEIYQGNPDNGNPMWLDTPLPFEHPAWPEMTLTDGDTIAVLAKQEEVEE